MAKITRKNQIVFGSGASNNGQFGSAQAGTKITSLDPDVIQNISGSSVAWLAGWLDATISSENLPTLEEMQGIQYVATYQLAYLFQEGIPEYLSTATYFQNSIVKKPGTFQLYGSLIDNNTGNALTVGADWQFLTDLTVAPGIPTAAAGGTVNAITATYTGAISSLTDRQIALFVATGANTSTTPTFAPNALTAHTITKKGGVALELGDIAGANFCALVCYNLANTRWELMNPAGPTISQEIGFFKPYASSTPPANYLECNGAAISRTTYAALFAIIGTTWGVGDGSTTFNIPDTRGYFVRGWDHGAGVDSGRAFASTQADAFASHIHNCSFQSFYTVTGSNTAYNGSGSGSNGGGIQATGGTETRPKNIAAMYCIRAF